MSDRGKILYPDRKQQINDFSGLLYGKITPTDIDGLIEYKDKAYVFLEIKYLDAELPYGQRLAIERIIKDISGCGKSTIAIVAKHNIFNTKESIPVASCEVRQFLLSAKDIVTGKNIKTGWEPPSRILTVRECIDLFIEHYVESNVQKKANTS